MTFDYASDDWLAALRRLAGELAAGRDLTGVDYTVSEELTDPPRHLLRAGSMSVGWHLRVRDGQVQIGHRPVQDADLRVVADYATHRALSRRVWNDDVDAIAAARKARQRAVMAGRLRTEGDLSEAPLPVVALVRDLHDPVAAITA